MRQRERSLRAWVPVRAPRDVVCPCFFAPGVLDCNPRQGRAGRESRGDAELGDAVRGEHVCAPGGPESSGSADLILEKPVSAPQEVLGSQAEPLQGPHQAAGAGCRGTSAGAGQPAMHKHTRIVIVSPAGCSNARLFYSWGASSCLPQTRQIAPHAAVANLSVFP